MSKFFVNMASMGMLAFALTPEFTTAFSLLVGACGIVLVNMYNARTQRIIATRAVEKAIAPVEAKIDALAPVVDKINTHVNGEKSRAISELAERDLQIKLQRELIDQMKNATALLAQAKAMTDVRVRGTDDPKGKVE